MSRSKAQSPQILDPLNWDLGVLGVLRGSICCGSAWGRPQPISVTTLQGDHMARSSSQVNQQAPREKASTAGLRCQLEASGSVLIGPVGYSGAGAADKAPKA